MKSYLTLFILMITFFSITVNAQEEKQMGYLFQGANMKVSGFGGPIMGFSGIQEDFAFFMGGGGAVLLNQSFFLGGYGLGLTTSHYQNLNNPGGNQANLPSTYRGKVEFGHGGFWVGYIHESNKPIHFGLSSKVGWGSAHLYDPYFDQNYSPARYSDNVFVFSPQLEVEFNMNTWLKINLGLGYRLVSGFDEEYILADGSTKKVFDSKDFNKPELTLNVYFGYFK